MEQADILQILTLSIRTILYASAPVTIGALAIGLVIALFQALTQIQEMTLTFVPKIIGILLILSISFPYIFSKLKILSDMIFSTIVSGHL